ncbi:hypothetical protein [Granulicella sp. dw_53]|uniref:hypothetical protein n=1 Tax=Granulicella sp. dw_53 TaxID=2719792 RepID=UPI001BD5DDE6|nr:hypothetical protein [Granulicella sp. dw_53]
MHRTGNLSTFAKDLAAELHKQLNSLRIGECSGLVDQEHTGVHEVFHSMTQYLKGMTLLSVRASAYRTSNRD